MRPPQPISLSIAFSEGLGLGVTFGLMHAMAETFLLGWSGLRPTLLDHMIVAAISVTAASLLSTVAVLAALTPPLRQRAGTASDPAAFRRVVWILIVAAYFLILLKIISYWSGWGTAVVWSLPAAPVIGVGWLVVRQKGQGPLVVACATGAVAFTFCALQLGPTDLEALTGIPYLRLRLFLPSVVGVLALVAVVKSTRQESSPKPIMHRGGVLALLGVTWATLWAGLYLAPRLGWPLENSGQLAGSSSRPNFLLIVLDTVRADHLDLFGYHRQTMPNLRRFAVEECLSANLSHTTAPWTVPSHASMFTGLYPSAHGAHYLFLGDADAKSLAYSLRDDVPTLAEFLSGMGYQTAGIVANYAMLPRFGLPRGFEQFDAAPGSRYLGETLLWSYRFRLGLLPSVAGLIRDQPIEVLHQRSVLFSARQPPYRRAGEITTRAQQWLRRHGGRPFFLFLNYMDAHDPYLPIPEDDERFVKRPNGEEWFGFPESRFRAAVRATATFTDREIEFLQAQYDAELVSMDREFSHLLDYLKESGLFEDTLILVTTDHGESFFEHGFPEHGNSLYEPEIGGFLLVKPPQSLGQVAPSPLMQSVDFFPTIAEILNEPPPSNLQGSAWGRGREFAMSEVFCKTCGCEAISTDKYPEQLRHELVAVTLDGHKVIRSSSAADMIYNLTGDRSELSSVTDPNPGLVGRAANIIVERNKRLVEALTGEPTDKSLLETLRSLGYIN